MQRKAILIGILVFTMLFAFSVNAWAESVVVKAQTDKEQYKVGDIVTVKVVTEQNTGLHSLFFDLAYDGSILQFDNLVEGSMVTGEVRKKEFLYAASDPATSISRGSHVIVSYTLQGNGAVTPRTGILCEVRFRVISPGNPNIRYQFTCNNTGITNGAGVKLTDVLWKNSNGFTIGSGVTSAFILITQPYEMQVVYGSQVEVDAVCSAAANYYVKYENQTNQQATELISAAQTNLPSRQLPLAFGYNNILATLYQRVNNKDYIIATDTVRVYRPEDTQFIKIISPKSHQLLNTDMVDVLVSSPYEPVTVNGMSAQYLEPGANNHKIYRARLWLKKGFNTITAEATGLQNVKYKDTIQIYYQKDSSIFAFTMPRTGEYFKPLAGTLLRIEGEIDSPYKTGVKNSDGTPARNTVTLKVIFRPTNPMEETDILVNEKQAAIVESTGSLESLSQYKFYNPFEIPLERLESGEIEIIAYKNKNGTLWDDEIHRFVYVDDNRLWIDLVQPNIFTYDLLDTENQFINFNENQTLNKANISISADGGIVLPIGQTMVAEQKDISNQSLTNVVDTAEQKDGILYALTNNPVTGSLSIYKKGTGDLNWQQVLNRPQMFGYALCMTDIGLLVGVSNLYATSDSGLYLFKDNKLINIHFPVTIEHVQFIENRNGIIYFYGNYYNYLYSFNIYTLVEDSTGLTVDVLNRTGLANNFSVKQFVLSSDCQTAILRAESGDIFFYNKTDAGYQASAVGLPDGENNGLLNGDNIITGEYTSGDYNVYLILKKDGTNIISVMEYKQCPHRYFTSTVGLSDWLGNEFNTLFGVGFKDNSFQFLYRSENSYIIKKGQVFFSKFYAESNALSYPFVTEPDQRAARLFITGRSGEIYLGGDSNPSNTQVTNHFNCLYKAISANPGTIDFNYVNDDIEGLTGFSLEVDPIWLVNQDAIEVGFAVREKADGVTQTNPSDTVLYHKTRLSLAQLLMKEGNDFYTISRQYEPSTGREQIHFEFKNIQYNRYLSFEFKLTPVGNSSPGIYNLKVNKKIHARVCAGAGDTVVVPIHGYVYDRTVTEVTVQQARILLGNDRSFRYDYEVNRSQKQIPVEISCVNSTGVTANLRFMVEIVDSQNKIDLIQYKQNDSGYQSYTAPLLSMTQDSITLSGKFYGLEGVSVGYELYRYEYKNGVESVVLAKRGLFDTIKPGSTEMDAIFQELGTNRNKLGSGYTAGTFQDQVVTFIPGRQQLRIYCENPGGFRQTFMVGGKYPDIDYNMPAGDQKIIFGLAPLNPPVTVQNVPIQYQLSLEAFEQEETLPSQTKRYAFKRTYELNGEIKSLYNFTNLIVKSYTPGLVFENGLTEQTVPVVTGNRFQIKVMVTMSDNGTDQAFDMGVIPTIPALNGLRTGIRLFMTKSYKDTNFIPDFSGIHPNGWTDEQKQSLRIPIRIKFNRNDIPATGCWMTLTVNHTEVVTGTVEPLDGTYYCLKDDARQIVELPGLKSGRNRIEWIMQYKGAVGQNSYVMSSSNSGGTGMSAYIFDYNPTGQYGSTQMSFSPALTTQYYEDSSLPVLNITKDKITRVSIALNGVIITEEQGVSESLSGISLNHAALRQGSNELHVTYKEPLQDPVTKTFTFLYDSQNPILMITNWKFAADGLTLDELTALVTEANFSKAYLRHGQNIKSRQPEVNIVSNDKYLLRWTGLASEHMTLSSISPVSVKVIDHSGKEGVSAPLIVDIQMPVVEPAREVFMNMPFYNGTPLLANESNYTAHPFSEHTKFAPGQYLPKQSVITQIGHDGDFLVRNPFWQKVIPDDAIAGDLLGRSFDIAGDEVFIGAHGKDSKGKVYIYKLDGNRNWIQTASLIASDGAAVDGFGRSLQISGNYAIIGAYGYDSMKGKAYIFERDTIGNWIQKAILVSGDGGFTNDMFGYSVGISGSYAIIGAYGRNSNKGKAYIFERDINGNWIQKQSLVAGDGVAEDHFGWDVAISGNYAIVTAYAKDVYKGKAYIYEQDVNGIWSLKSQIGSSDGVAYDRFGVSVAMSGNLALIGEYGRDTNKGRINTFERDGSGNWVLKQTINPGERISEDYYGFEVALSTNLAIVSANGRDSNRGKVYVYNRDAYNNLTNKSQFIANDRAVDDEFGRGVTVGNNNLAIVGAPFNDDRGTNSGSAYFINLADLSTQLKIPNDKKYLVFKVTKDTITPGITQKSELVDKIWFEAVKFKQDPASLNAIQEPAVPQPLSGLTAYYIEGLNHIYYVVDIASLKDKFSQACQTIIVAPPYIESDRGALKVRYDPNVLDNVAEIYVTIDLNDATKGLKDVLFYDPAYESSLGSGIVHPNLNHSTGKLTFTRTTSAANTTVSFWFRPEDEGLTEQNYIETITKRIFTIKDAGNNPILGIDYRGGVLYFSDLVNNVFPQVGTLMVDRRQWNLVTLRINQANHQIIAGVANQLSGTFAPPYTELLSTDINKTLALGAQYCFGPTGINYNSGFYSIASAFYIDRTLTDEEIYRNFSLGYKNSNTERYYVFHDPQTDFSDQFYDLRLIKDTGSPGDYFTLFENLKAFQIQGSLKASSRMTNFLRKLTIEGKDYMVLNEATSFVPLNLDVQGGQGSFTIKPTGVKGRYYFGDKNSNYNLGLDRWYSISGSVIAMDPKVDAWMVLRINEREQKWPLTTGRFHFVYDNTRENLVPVQVKLYIETDGQVTLGTDMAINQGNYILPKTLERSAAKTQYPFDLSGTIQFWYKPLNANINGLVNYADIVMFDSELVKIYTRLDEDGDAVYAADIKNSEGTLKTISTHVKVRHGWHHLQISYCFKDTPKSVFFYIDGSLAGAESCEIQPFGSMAGIPPESDNVWIGCDSSELRYAQGYLDEVKLGKYCEAAQFVDMQPAAVTYLENSKTVELTLDEGLTIESCHYRLETLDNSLVKEGNSITDFPIDISQIPAGRYRLTTELVFHSHNYRDILFFNVDNRPRFVLKERTPIIFTDLAKDLYFKFRSDISYRFGGDQLQYMGLAGRISYSLNGSLKTQTVYLAQDFMNQKPEQWLVGTVEGGLVNWEPISPDNTGLLSLAFSDVTTTTMVNCKFKYFYFLNNFSDEQKFENLPDLDLECNIPIAVLTQPVKKEKDGEGNEYKLLVDITGGEGGSWDPSFKDIQIEYKTAYTDDSNIPVKQGSVGLTQSGSNSGMAELFYDDILCWNGSEPLYGSYTCKLKLKYQGIIYMETGLMPLVWSRKTTQVQTSVVEELEINEFSLLYINRQDPENPTASFCLKYSKNGLGVIEPKLEIISDSVTGVTGLPDNIGTEATYIFNSIFIPKGQFKVRLTLTAKDTMGAVQFIRSSEIEIDNTPDKPEIILTNWVDALIQYNNVLFSWKGYYQGQFNENIEYQYNLDNQGWTSLNKNWRSVRFYQLAEGYHNFQVRASFHNVTSEIRQVTFFVDIHQPVIAADKLKVQKVYDSQGVMYAVNLSGTTGAISDVSLHEVYVNGTRTSFQTDGSFMMNNLPLTVDGSQPIVITAYDKVGNCTNYTVTVDNPITEILYPVSNRTIRYSPLTLIGKINKEINNGVTIYVADTYSTTKGDYSGWKKAKINPDRTFFVEDLFVNPGTSSRAIKTTLKLACVFDSGKTFEREIEVQANEVLRPIEMNLSTRATEGENSDTSVTISCQANVPNISTWSIDFDGDGVYDLVDMVTNPDSQSARQHTWVHKYAALGLVAPRVRVITTEGDFFSTTQNLIIHEKIREASFKLVNNPIAISTIRMPDESNRIFVLHKQDEQFMVEVYEVRRNDNYISKKLYDINLTALEIENPVKLKALDSEQLIVAANKDGLGMVYQLKANQFGNYQVKAFLHLNDEIKDFTVQGQNVLVSMMNRNSLAQVSLVNGLIQKDGVAYINVTLTNTLPLRENAALETDGNDIFVADYFNQRVIQLSPSMQMMDQFGVRGTGEGEFIWPGIIRYHENRIFVSDSGRHDIQVFDRNFNPLCTLGYRNDPGYANYVEPEFFADIADLEVIAREEGNRLYYYALVLSRSTGKLSMIRLPQWDELKVRVRNNKIVFLKDGELYTAKPDGGDLQKVLSSDSLPRIEGTIDYPALAPDGRKLAFTSRMLLYNGQPVSGNVDISYTYCNLYYVNLENRKLTKLDLGTLEGYELERPVFNSNGSKLAFSAKMPRGKWRLYTYDFQTGLVAKLFEVDENARYPYFSPDDRYIIFTSDFGGDEEVEIVAVDNPSVRIALTSNNCRDSLPVWSTVYPGEITNQDLQKVIKSKVAFVSERNTHKGVYCIYLSQETDGALNVYDLKNRQVVGNNPDSAALEITTYSAEIKMEGDYPCFTGDGRNLIFEYFDGRLDLLKKLDFETNLNPMLQGQPKVYGEMQLVVGATRPAGMKNMVTNFRAANWNGNEVALTWDRYTDNDIFYIVQYKVVNSADVYQSYVLSQSGTVLTGLKMGMDYLIRVFIVENDVEVATSYWMKVKMPEVVARPSFTIDPNNPYLVRLHAWKPEPAENYKWRFSWVVENTEIQVQNSQDYLYEFGTSGTKTVFLKAYTEGQTATHVSEPLAVEIISDIKPVIEHNLAEDVSYIELSAEKSLGKKLNLASAQWIISGPGREPITATGSKVIIQLDGFQHKINVSLTLQRIAVNNQIDIMQVNKTIDLDIKEVKPIITYEATIKNNRLIRFSGEYSQGNINWMGVRWTLYADGGIIYNADGVTTFDYLFPETNQNTVYTVSLTVPRRSDGKTATVSQVITVAATPIEPKISYQILELKQGSAVVGAKLLLDCTESKGNGIDYTLARWAVPTASNYGDQAMQVGPTAIYNLVGIQDDIVIDVTLTLSRKNGTEPVTVTKLININRSKLPEGKLVVNKQVEESNNGKMLTLDVFKSTGPNIDWERTEWVIDGQANYRGPMVRKEIPAAAKDVTISFTCLLYRFGAATPETVKDKVKLGKTTLRPIITARRLSGTQHRMYELHVLDTPGVNIDWERTDWYIYDGGERAVQLRGSSVAYDFPFRSGQMGYPVLVEMYLKGDSYPFVNSLETIDVEGDELVPIISTEVDPKQPNVITFNAIDSKGSNINWAQTKWNFGDSKESQYGPVVTYEYPISKKSATYKVTLTLTRTNVNGFQEIKTFTKDIIIGPDKIKAIIKVKKNGDNLVLSAEDSQGKGLLLDRCVWLFDGKGDSESISTNIQTGEITRESYNLSASASLKVGFSLFGASSEVGTSLSASHGWDTTSYDNYKNETTSFSSQNSLVGAICRRYIGGKRYVTVTLFVYRMTAEGGVEGESITVNINLANIGGGIYGK